VAAAKPGAYGRHLGVAVGTLSRWAAMKGVEIPFVNLTKRPTLIAASWRLAHSSRTCLGVVLR
jgi:hypothetical protein